MFLHKKFFNFYVNGRKIKKHFRTLLIPIKYLLYHYNKNEKLTRFFFVLSNNMV